MYIAKIYSKKYQTAFVVLGHCKNADMVILEIDLFQLQTGIKLPAQITTADIAKYQWQNMTVVKFHLSPAMIFDAKDGSYGDWLMLDDNPDLLGKLTIMLPDL